jgi:hypothetical protein
MASFFNRTYVTKKNFLAEREEGGLKFRTTAGEEKQARLLFLTGAVLDEPASESASDEEKTAREARFQEDQNRETPPAPPAYSRRARLVEIALRADSGGYFAKAFVNRVWARLFGTGLVMPLDQMHSGPRCRIARF